MKGTRRKAQGTRHKEESTALFITIPVGASFACDRRIYELRDCGLRILDLNTCGSGHSKVTH
jgi:hypothetical protein